MLPAVVGGGITVMAAISVLIGLVAQTSQHESTWPAAIASMVVALFGGAATIIGIRMQTRRRGDDELRDMIREELRRQRNRVQAK